MSHVTMIEVEVKDIECLEKACEELGIQFKRDCKRANTGFTTRNCNHAITIADRDVGVKVQKNGAVKFLYDFYGITGRKMKEKVGDNFGILLQHYAMHKITKEARRKGQRVHRVNEENGKIKLYIGAR